MGGNREGETWVYTLGVDDGRGRCRGGNGVELPVVLVLLDAAVLRSSLCFCPPCSPCWVLMPGAWSGTGFGVMDGGGGGAAGSAI